MENTGTPNSSYKDFGKLYDRGFYNIILKSNGIIFTHMHIADEILIG